MKNGYGGKRMRLEFEEPTSGWLPVTISHDNVVEKFYSSDVPNNPIEDLVSVLASSSSGWGGEVWWHLEPEGYYLILDPQGEELTVKLEYSKTSKKLDRELVFEYTGNSREVFIPLWRDLMKFQSHGWSKFSVPEVEMES